MKIITIALALLLTGCAHNQSWVGPAVAGAVIGAAINDASHQHQQPRHYQPPPPPVYYHPRPRQCYSIPLYDYYGRYIGARVDCR